MLDYLFTKECFNRGTVYIAGFGPGDTSLITVKVLSLILNADVIIYDYLVDKNILSLCPSDTEKIYVGKQAGRHTLKQEEINKLIVDKAKENRIVLRLKGGDPFVFGRGSEEAVFCRENNIDFEIVPAITSSMASAAYAGIPVTHRNVAVSFAMVTGHEDPSKPESQINWKSLAGIDTLAVYMGVKNMNSIVTNLISNGKPADTPAAVIQWGTYNNQKVVTGTLSNIHDTSVKNNITPPSLLVIGNVISLRKDINWFENKKLFNKKIIVTRSRTQISKLSMRLRSMGADVIEFPTIEIKPPENYYDIDNNIKDLDKFDYVVFTSENGVFYFIERLLKIGYDIRKFADCKIISIGKATSKKLMDYHLVADLESDKFVAESLFEKMKSELELKDKNILLPRADIARPFLKDALMSEGAAVTEIKAYRTIKPEYTGHDISNIFKNKIDWITFTSSSTVKHFFELIKDKKDVFINNKIKIASIGPITTKTIKEHGLEPDTEASEYTIDGLIDSIIKYNCK